MVNATQTVSTPIIEALAQSRGEIAIERQNLSAQMSRLMNESQSVAEQLERAREEVGWLTARTEGLNNGRAVCSRTTTKSDVKALVLADIEANVQCGRNGGELKLQSSGLGQYGNDDRLITAALDELEESLNGRGVTASISCRVTETSVFEDKDYDISWDLRK